MAAGHDAALPPTGPAPLNPASRIRNAFRVSSGNFLEMYDFMVFGYFATPIGRAFFPSGNAYLSLMLAFGTFGAGFLMRPLGAIVLGAYSDRRGRRAGLLLSLALMSLGILSIACTPGYQVIGIAAPLLVVAGRLLQGFSAGMELGGVSVYLSEIAPTQHQGLYVSAQSGSQQVAVMAAALIGVLLSANLSPDHLTRWGWRIPLLGGCALIPLLWHFRRRLAETDAFNARTDRPALGQLLRSLCRNWRIVSLGTLMVTMTTVSFYMITAYTPTFGASVLHLASSDALVVTLCVGASNLSWLPIMGSLSDRIGRRPILLASTVVMCLSAFPAMQWLVREPSFSRLLAVELWFSFLYGSYNAAMVVYLIEIMPAPIRTTGFALAYSLAAAAFGGFTPAICTWLIHATGNRAMPGLWLSLAALCGLVAASRPVRPWNAAAAGAPS